MGVAAPQHLRALIETRVATGSRPILARRGGHAVASGPSRGNMRGPDSDVDFLLELAPDARPFEILPIGAELEDVARVIDMSSSR